MSRRENGEGTIRLRADGRWEARVRTDGQRRSIFGESPEDVSVKLLQARVKIAQGQPLPPERTTVEQYLAVWLDSVRVGDLRPRTWQRYEQLLRIHIIPGLGQLKLARLSPADVQRHTAPG